MDMTCSIVRDLLPLYHDGVCGEDSRAAVEAHLAGCVACREELSAMAEKLGNPMAQEDRTALNSLAIAWKKAKKRSFLKGIIITAVVVVLLLGAYSICFFTEEMEGVSMSPTIDHGAVCLFTRFGEPEIGDIVAVRLTLVATHISITDIARIAAGPGDTVSIQNGTLYVNGEASDLFSAGTVQKAFWGDGELIIPPGEYFVIGDNQENSYDSISYGTVLRENILGRYICRLITFRNRWVVSAPATA